MITLDSTANAPQAKATYREWVGLGILALPCILYAMDLTILNLAVPSISVELKPTAAQLLWMVDIYGFLAAGSLLVMGTLGDRIGRRKLLLFGSAAFGLVSLCASFAKSAEWLIVLRALLGVASATMAPSTLSLISNMFLDDREKTFAVSLWVASFSLGGAMGPAVGGIVLAHFAWGAVFLVPLPALLLLLLLGRTFLPEYKAPGAGGMDIVSAVLSLASVLPVIYGIKIAAEGGNHLWAVTTVFAGLACGALFIRRQLSLKDPLLDLRLFKRLTVTAALTINVLDFFVGFGVLVLVAQYLQLVIELTPLQAGLWSIPSGVGSIVGSLMTSPTLKVMRPAYALACGLIVGAVGAVLMAHAAGAHNLGLIIIGSAVLSLGTAPGTAIVADFIVSAAPPERAGAVSALNETASEFGGAVGIALLGSLATLLYRSELGRAMPGHLSAASMQTALRGIGAAKSLLRDVGGGETLMSAARAAYAQAASITFLTGSGILLLAAAIVVVSFRKPQNHL
jgi:DHA2 family multidrug resistance protein-like MFS transporter